MSDATDRGKLELAGRTFVWGTRTYIMGIINVTPDSFSGDGLALHNDSVAAALAQARRFVDEGADMLDVGGESTRPGAQPVSIADEQARVVPVVAALARELALPISVDTYHAEVAAAALDAGAQMVNDVWGLRTPDRGWNTALAEVVRAHAVPLVLTHNRRAQAADGHYVAAHYDDLMGEIIADLRASMAFAEAQGITREQLIIDPGIGFGKTPEQNISLVRHLAALKQIGLPILLGTSRKSFIGLVLGLPPDQRDEGTVATTALGIQAGIDIVRVHNVLLNARVARMADVLTR